MAGNRRVTWQTLLPMIALVVAACGGATPAGTGSPTAIGSSQPGDDAPAPPSGSIDPAAFNLDIEMNQIVATAAQENADRTRGRTKADIAGYLGPDALTVAAALDQQQSDELWKLVDDAAVAKATSTVPNVILAAAHTPRTDRNDPAIVPPGMSFMGPVAASVALVAESLGSDKTYSKSKHDESPVELGPNKGTVTTDSTVSVTASGSRLVVDVVTKTKGEVNDANGHLVFRIDGSGHAHIEVQACPNAQGTAQANVEFSVTEEYFISSPDGRGGHSWHDDQTSDAQIVANDNADLDHEVVNLKFDYATKGGNKAAGAGQSTLTDYTISVTESGATLAPDGTFAPGTGPYDARNVTKGELSQAYESAEFAASYAIYTAAKAAEKFWRSGKCIEVVVDPMGGDVGANSATTVTARVRHKIDGGDLDKTVVAAMTGVKSIEPAGQKLPAPATFTYTAGPKPKDAGVVTFKSVSNRGIGETTVTFTVGGGWNTERDDQAGDTYKGQKCGGLDGVWRIDGKANGEGQKTTTTWLAKIDETTLAGTYTYKAVTILITEFGDVTTTATGTGKASLVAQADGSLLMTIAGTTVKSTVSGLGTTQTTSIPIPALQFTWIPGGTCPA